MSVCGWLRRRWLSKSDTSCQRIFGEQMERMALYDLFACVVLERMTIERPCVNMTFQARMLTLLFVDSFRSMYSCSQLAFISNCQLIVDY